LSKYGGNHHLHEREDCAVDEHLEFDRHGVPPVAN
jgi:hypothetical protein